MLKLTLSQVEMKPGQWKSVMWLQLIHQTMVSWTDIKQLTVEDFQTALSAESEEELESIMQGLERTGK